MRIPFPDRFNPKLMFVFIVVLFIGQIATGTNLYFALLVAGYNFLFAMAFNLSGGISWPSGAYIFFTGTLVIDVGLVYKLFLLEPAESHLLAPLTSMAVNCGTMGALALAVFCSKRLTPKTGFLSKMNSYETMMQAAVGCLVIGTIFLFAFGSGGVEGSSIGSAIGQINRFPEFAIMLATAYQIRKTNGRSAINLVVLLSVGVIFAFGVIYTSKEGMFLGFVTWLLTAVAYRFDFKFKQLLIVGIVGFFLVYYMVPFSQYVRNFRDKDGLRVNNQAVVLEYLFKLGEVRTLYKEETETDTYSQYPHLYDTPQGLVDRLSMLPGDDALIARTDEGHSPGLYPTYVGTLNTIPKFLYPNKPYFYAPNEYGRELGVLSPDDLTTGISFGAGADIYHQAKYFGVLVVLPLIAFCYFLLTDTFAGSVKDSPWPLLLIVLASHLAPEGMIEGMLLQIVEGSFGLLFMAATIRYVFPTIIRVVTGGEKTVVRKGRQFRPAPRVLPRNG